MKHLFLFTGFCAALAFNASTVAQTVKERTEVTAGLSFTEAYNIGLRYRIHKSKVWINVGTFPSSPFVFHSSMALSRELWGKSKFTEEQPWYIKIGLGYSHFPDYPHSTPSANYIMARLQLGRDFNITKRFGITASVGPFAEIYREDFGTPEGKFDLRMVEYPGLDMSIFYRLAKPEQ